MAECSDIIIKSLINSLLHQVLEGVSVCPLLRVGRAVSHRGEVSEP